MRFLTDRISSLGIGWNERPLSSSNFYAICLHLNIEVQEIPLNTDGFYFRVLGRDIIAVNSQLPETKKLMVLFHELGHFLFHTPETGPAAGFHGIGRRDRKECEADIFALCAIIPRTLIESRTPQELIQEGFPVDIVAARYEILATHGL